MIEITLPDGAKMQFDSPVSGLQIAKKISENLAKASVAINVDADILLIDEILAVGDYSFQQKCFEKLKEIKARGTTIVIVSHSLSQIENICECSYWIENGVIVDSGIPKYVHERYLSSMENERMEKIEKEKKDSKVLITEDVKVDNGVIISKEDDALPIFCSEKAIRMGNKKIEIIDFELKNSKNENRSTFRAGEDVILHISYKKNGAASTAQSTIAGVSFRPDSGYWYDISDTDKFENVLNQFKNKLNDTAVDMFKRFGIDYESACQYLLDEKFYEYKVELDFLEDVLGVEKIQYRVNEIVDALTDSERQQIEEYRNGAMNKMWMLNRCNLRFVVDKGFA